MDALWANDPGAASAILESGIATRFVHTRDRTSPKASMYGNPSVVWTPNGGVSVPSGIMKVRIHAK